MFRKWLKVMSNKHFFWGRQEASKGEADKLGIPLFQHLQVSSSCSRASNHPASLARVWWKISPWVFWQTPMPRPSQKIYHIVNSCWLVIRNPQPQSFYCFSEFRGTRVLSHHWSLHMPVHPDMCLKARGWVQHCKSLNGLLAQRLACIYGPIS